MIMQWSEAW